MRLLTASLVLSFSTLLSPGIVQASGGDDFPNKPIRIVVAYSPGGGADVLTRRIGERLAKRLQQPVIIDNKPGGNTIIASEAVARAAPDGYTLYSTNTSLLQIPFLYPGRYDAIKDFKGVAQYAAAPLALAVPASAPVGNLREFVEYLKQRPGKTSYGTAGVGGTQHILSEAFKKKTGVDSIQVPYKGEAPLLTDFLGGQIDWYIATPISILPHVKSGKVRLLAVTGTDRFDLAPDVPTFREEGIPELAIVGWYGLFAPAATPAAIVEKISREVSEVVKSPEISQYLRENGLIPTGTGTAEFAPAVAGIQEAWGRMIRENNIRTD